MEKKQDEAPQTTGPKLVGQIASISRSRDFVLIQSYGPWTTPPATVLTSRGSAGQAANLRFTGETKGPFAAADIQSGQVEKGDAVYTLHMPKPKTPATPDAPSADAILHKDVSIGELPKESRTDPPLPP